MFAVSRIAHAAPQGIGDGREKFLPVEWFREQPVVTWPIERRPIQQIRATGDQNDRQPGPCRVNSSYEFKTVHGGHADVRDQDVNLPQATTL